MIWDEQKSTDQILKEIADIEEAIKQKSEYFDWG